MRLKKNARCARSTPASIASNAKDLFDALRKVEPANDQGEYYLTDVAEIILRERRQGQCLSHSDAAKFPESTRAPSWRSLKTCCAAAAIRRLMIEGGVTFIDPSHAYISAEAQIGRDAIIYPDVTIEGKIGDWRRLCDSLGRAHHKFASR